ncbi:TPA: helix-turn-helix domain-containing protein [Pseudomonas putida]|uniref:Transcriptional regulator, AraC family n=1 Tax=Pseudomonas putida (strain GB-1) TaxID=76869 RepID=B0KTF9_PSEPG|nr:MULTISPECIES: helix-turn-helix domain-containing protein [Pseudomonas]ABY98646.1 transcriptional regulator, AraC family [Pseudomonas putida GB-1]APE98970.1 AraC family transcriptional regulator [Pseudomonas putida]MBP0709619.1 helix-turn-helix domain-containing protein [Pseudomonas sp. T34]MCE1001566.1 helix-turn-helix domain-containing protein [Pseudomonas sp. NMI1173_11]MCK2189062.1 helix-turn-helix domain-containing protein [Pseudomonas sp. MB04B]
MNKIPNYALYGETAQPVWHEALHVEQISQRSGAHNWEIAAHRHEGLLQLLYLQSGGGEVLFDSDRLQVHAPCVVYVPAQVVHGFHWAGQVEGQVITAAQHPLESIAQVLAPNLLVQLRKPQVVALPKWAADEDPLLPLCRALREEYHNRAREHVASSMALLLTLMIQVLRHEPHLPQGEQRPVSRRSQQLTAFRELVDLHYRAHRPLADYAAELGMTLATLGRLCQEHLGMTPMNVINARQVLEAKRMLGHSSLSVKEIAHELGFADVGYFSRFFRKQAGVSPSAFREGH